MLPQTYDTRDWQSEMTKSSLSPLNLRQNMNDGIHAPMTGNT